MTGFAGLEYPITQVSLAVSDLEQTMADYHRLFGWSGWDVFHHQPPAHHDTELRGEQVHYTLKGAEVMVGSLNFELLEPVDGPSLWKEFIGDRGEGIASIATMFQTMDEGEAVKREFAERGMPVTMKANIGDHIEYYYLDTQDRFGCLIESGSGHATDFVSPAYVYPDEPTASRAEITQVVAVVRDLEQRVGAYEEAFGWGPWKHFDGKEVMRDCELDGKPCDPFDVRWAKTTVGDLEFELCEPGPGDSPWRRILDRRGEAIGGINVTGPGPDGFAVVARARVGDGGEWRWFDTESTLKCTIGAGSLVR
ncbi:MAG TPA: VOC family protein [Gaiellaceae bacterium]